MKEMTFVEAVQDALSIALELDPAVICYGLGVDDPKGIFGTTLGLQDRFGEQRVFDMPTSENAMTGIAIGAALNGIRPVMTHQRLDFFLLAMDQLVNNAAKWHYMFGGQASVPITIRLILGRGWGQGPTHAQNLQAWFAHVPGLKVVMPTMPEDAKGLLLSAIFDPNPVLFLEHRWLHNLSGLVPDGDYRVELGKARVVAQGNDVTIVASSYMTIEALRAIEYLKDEEIYCDLIDLRSIRPIDWESIFSSVRKTGRLLVLDTANPTCSVASEIIARASMECFDVLKIAPDRIALPDVPSPTSQALTKAYYPNSTTIVERVGGLLGRQWEKAALGELHTSPHDVPGDWFKGPF
jgi:acetoin:2,6-dichlorophenolindophenol oxidoreductase subunit beta